MKYTITIIIIIITIIMRRNYPGETNTKKHDATCLLIEELAIH